MKWKRKVISCHVYLLLSLSHSTVVDFISSRINVKWRITEWLLLPRFHLSRSLSLSCVFDDSNSLYNKRRERWDAIKIWLLSICRILIMLLAVLLCCRWVCQILFLNKIKCERWKEWWRDYDCEINLIDFKCRKRGANLRVAGWEEVKLALSCEEVVNFILFTGCLKSIFNFFIIFYGIFLN